MSGIYGYDQRMWVCFAHVIDDCETVDLNEGAMSIAFLRTVNQYKKSDNELSQGIEEGKYSLLVPNTDYSCRLAEVEALEGRQ